MRVYLSARFERQAELCRYAAQLRQGGIDVVSRWLAASHDDEHTDPARAAMIDLVDVVTADTLVAFTDAPSMPRGGRHVEFGIAIGLSQTLRPPIRLIVCGPSEHVFHSLPGVEHAATWPQALALIVTTLRTAKAV